MSNLFEKMKEAVASVLPISIIMTILCFILKLNTFTIYSVILSSILIIIGIGLFSYGAEISMIEIGKNVASDVLKTKKLSLIISVALAIGIVITLAEPNIKVLASQITAIPEVLLIGSIAIGVALFLCFSFIRILLQINMKIVVGILYGILLLILLISSNNSIPLAFDAGGVTTGPIAVPFIMALGMGFAKGVSKKWREDSLGLVAMCSIGPIIIVSLLTFFMKGGLTYEYNISNELTTSLEFSKNFANEIPVSIKTTLVSLLPILLLFIIYNIVNKKIVHRNINRTLSGLFISFVGLILFFIGVNAGYTKASYIVGIELYKQLKKFIIPIIVLMGFTIVKAEPAVVVLTSEIEKMTQGSLKKNLVTTTLSLGVSIAVFIAIYRLLNGISIRYFLLVSYALAIILMIKSPKLFTMLALDSGGAVSGPLSTSILLPVLIGICYQMNGNVLTDAFGVVGLTSISPLITLQALGILYDIKMKKTKKTKDLDEEIIEYKWGE